MAWRCPLPACTGTIMPGEKNPKKRRKKPKTLLLQDCPGHLDGSTPRGSSPAHESFIQAGHLTQTVTKLQFDAKNWKKPIVVQLPAGVPGA